MTLIRVLVAVLDVFHGIYHVVRRCPLLRTRTKRQKDLF